MNSNLNDSFSQNEKSKEKSNKAIPIQAIAATIAGNALEFYDFVTYAFFAVYIGKTFFPAENETVSLLLSVTVFGVGFISRPIGSLWIGSFADRVGRKPALLLTMSLMTLGTFVFSITPSYESIGIAAPIIVVICRLIQGLAVGGEIGPASSFLLEIAPKHRRGLYSSWLFASQGFSTFLAGIIGLILTQVLSEHDLQVWGWRIPFFVGLLMLPLIFYLRKKMPETLLRSERPRIQSMKRASKKLKSHWRTLFLGVLILMAGTISAYVGQYMTTYAISTLSLSPELSMTATVAGGISMLVFGLLGGLASDHFGRRPTMLIPRLLVLILVYPAFSYLVHEKSVFALLSVSTLLLSLASFSATASMVTLSESIPMHLRSLGLSVIYAISIPLFGGTTQTVITWLIQQTGNPLSPAWYVMLTSAITLIAMWFLPESKGQKIT